MYVSVCVCSVKVQLTESIFWVYTVSGLTTLYLTTNGVPILRKCYLSISQLHYIPVVTYWEIESHEILPPPPCSYFHWSSHCSKLAHLTISGRSCHTEFLIFRPSQSPLPLLWYSLIYRRKSCDIAVAIEVDFLLLISVVWVFFFHFLW